MSKNNDKQTVNTPWMTIAQLSEYLSVSSGTIHNWVSQKYIPYAKRGRIVRFHRQKIDEWLAADFCLGRHTIAQDILGDSQSTNKSAI